MARIILADGGQHFTLPDDTVTTDQQVVEILRQSYPELGTPTIQRETQAGELVITVIKRPGSKGYAANDPPAAPMAAMAYAAVVHNDGALGVVALGITKDDALQGLRDWWATQQHMIYKAGTVVHNAGGETLPYPPPETATVAEMDAYFTGDDSAALYQIAVVPVPVVYNAGKKYGGS